LHVNRKIKTLPAVQTSKVAASGRFGKDADSIKAGKDYLLVLPPGIRYQKDHISI